MFVGMGFHVPSESLVPYAALVVVVIVIVLGLVEPVVERQASANFFRNADEDEDNDDVDASLVGVVARAAVVVVGVETTPRVAM